MPGEKKKSLQLPKRRLQWRWSLLPDDKWQDKREEPQVLVGFWEKVLHQSWLPRKELGGQSWRCDDTCSCGTWDIVLVLGTAGNCWAKWFFQPSSVGLVTPCPCCWCAAQLRSRSTGARQGSELPAPTVPCALLLPQSLWPDPGLFCRTALGWSCGRRGGLCSQISVSSITEVSSAPGGFLY